MDYNRLNGPQRGILREVLLGTFGSRAELNQLLVEADFPPLQRLVAGDLNLDLQISELIGLLMRKGTIGRFVEAVRNKFSEAPALDDLDGRLSAVDLAIRSDRGITDRNLERTVRAALDIDVNIWAAKLTQLGRRVCRISYAAPEGTILGTGFLLGSSQVLTNFHVVERIKSGAVAPDKVSLRFGYAESLDDVDVSQTHRLARNWLGPNAPYSEADLTVDAGLPGPDEIDFAVLNLATSAGKDVVIGGRREWVDLTTAVTSPEPGGIVFILQHPLGAPLQMTVGTVLESPSPLRVRYDANTGEGSSGALVLDTALRPVALHHAGDPNFDIVAQYNQGIPLLAIREAIQRQRET